MSVHYVPVSVHYVIVSVHYVSDSSFSYNTLFIMLQ